MAHDVKLLAVAVLYRCHPSESPTVTSLLSALAKFPGLSVSVLLFDNGGDEAADEVGGLPAGWAYHRSPTNVGVAGAYQFAFARAATYGASHLLLLDQDTHFDADFLRTVLLRIEVCEDPPDVLLPIVLTGELTISPLAGLIGKRPVKPGACAGAVRAINSGMVIRLNFIERIGGFDCRFWLDGLDHWLMLQARRSNARVVVIGNRLQHNLSISKGISSLPIDRFQNILLAERLLFEDFWDLSERLLYLARLTKRALKTIGSGGRRTADCVAQWMWALCRLFVGPFRSVNVPGIRK